MGSSLPGPTRVRDRLSARGRLVEGVAIVVLPEVAALRARLRAVLQDKAEQGHVTDGLAGELERTPDSYDAMEAFAGRLASLPLRDDWPFVEPDDLEAVRAECDPARPLGALAPLGLEECAARVEAAFLGRVCGCILGKPLEFDPTLEQIRGALEPLGEWPLRDYLPERALDSLPYRHPQWPETVRERIAHVAPDDDLNYTILGMLTLEARGTRFARADLRDLWLLQLPVGVTFGPERTLLLKAGLDTLARLETGGPPGEDEMEVWARVLNPGDELCGALIRADAYGYACLGRPEIAAELAWRDAGLTHRRTGIYGAMFVAAAIAIAPFARSPLGIFEEALRYVPRRSRFHRAVSDSLTEVAAASGWLDAYERVHLLHGAFTHCRIYQEIGTVANTVRFAESVGDGICKQVMQGNDTDSFGATAGSILGAFFGPGHLEPRWTDPFRDDVHTALAVFYERSLSGLAERMAALPRRVAADLGEER
ncbi:MAG: ADP-ribosylglycohydrolase family protein [Acidobacteria bacterium]|nr:ADP-ribosylglycohydrolase family protein [Acidobacteriota bacterium]